MFRYLLVSAAALCFAAPAVAQTPAAGSGALAVTTCPPQADADAARSAEEGHVRLLDQTYAALDARGFAGLAENADKLRRALAAAPACFPRIEQQGDRLIVRANDQPEYEKVSRALVARGVTAPSDGKLNTYPTIAFLLGSHLVEEQRYGEALVALDRGLAMQPRNELVMLEKVAALQGLQRFAEAQAILETALGDADLAPTLDRARFLRLSGVTLIDLNRLDDAEAVLKESLRLEPNNAATQNELDYIAELRAGAARRALEITASGVTKKD